MTIREYRQAGGEGEILWESERHPELPLPDKDAREYALQAFIDYLSTITFQMTGAKQGQTVPFKIPLKNMFIEWPAYEDIADKGEDDFPRVGFEILEETDEYPGFVASEVEGTDDLFAPGTILTKTGEHVETMDMHILCRNRAERRAIIAAIGLVMNPVQEITGLRFNLPLYFGAACRITLEGGGRVEDQDATRNRRLLKFKILLRVPNFYLVKLDQFNPQVEVDLAPVGANTGPTG